MNEQQVFVHDKYFDLLVEAGMVRPVGEVLDGKDGKLHKCDLLGQEPIAWLDWSVDFEHTQPDRDQLHIEHDLADDLQL